MPTDDTQRPEDAAARLSSAGVRSVAIFEGAKGLIVLAAGFGLLSLLHRDVQAAAESVVRHLHLNPAHHSPEIFIRAASRVQDSRLGLLAAGAFVYAAFRLVEAYGLWHEQPWAEWLAIISAGLYLPVEIFELWRHLSTPGALLLVGNAALVAGLLHIRLSARRAEKRCGNVRREVRADCTHSRSRIGVKSEDGEMARLQPVLNKSEEALVNQMAEITQAKKTDVIKNALTVYHWFIKQTVGGASVVARKSSGEESTLQTPELAFLEGHAGRLSPAELKRLATDLTRTRDPKTAARIRERMTRGFYGI